MKNYDLKGILVGGRKAVIAISLPVPKNGNTYFIYETHLCSNNEILIHFKDFTGKDLSGVSENLESFIIDLTDSKFSNFNFSNEIKVALCHENYDELKDTPENIFANAYNEFKENKALPNRTGTGTIRT
jgi:hypothetical protein